MRKQITFNKILHGDSLEILRKIPDGLVDCVVTSPPYWALRDYGVSSQLGSEKTPDEYVCRLCDIFDETKRVLKDSGTCWVNIGDTYGGSGQGGTGKNATKNSASGKYGPTKRKTVAKSLALIPQRFAIEMTRRGWILRNEIIWHKPNVMPSSVKDRFTVDFEPVFFFTKSREYTFNQQKEPVSQVSLERAAYGFKSKKANLPGKNSRTGFQGVDVEKMGVRFVDPAGRNKRTVWRIPTSGSRLAHVAMFPEKLIEPMILAGSPLGGVVLDPFMGSGTTAVVALKNSRRFLGIELNEEYIKMAEDRLAQMTAPLL